MKDIHEWLFTAATLIITSWSYFSFPELQHGYGSIINGGAKGTRTLHQRNLDD